jgi:hypothetical protein
MYFFKEKSDVNFNNFRFISDDQIFKKRLWIYYGFDKNKHMSDKYDILKKSNIKEKIGIIKFQVNILYNTFLLYDSFLDDIFEEFIND